MSLQTPRRRAVAPALFLAALLVWAVWPWLPFSRAEAAPPTIVFYGFSILADAMNDGIFPAFRKIWKDGGHGDVEFISSFAGSGTVTNQVILGVPAQLVLLSLESDAERLADAGVVAEGSWKSLPHGGVVNLTPFVILVRAGNPLGIRDFGDLALRRARIVHPDPADLGRRELGDRRRVRRRRSRPSRIVPRPARRCSRASGRTSSPRLPPPAPRGRSSPRGSAMPSSRTSRKRSSTGAAAGSRPTSSIRRRTILSEHTLVVVGRNVSARERPLIEAFTQFLWSEEAQRIFVRYGFRSVDEGLNAGNAGFGAIADAFRIADFGGWRRAKRDIVEAIWKNRVMNAGQKP